MSARTNPDRAHRGAKKPGPAASVDATEAAKFSAMAEEWWDPAGKFRALHRLNPTRLSFIRDRLAVYFGRDPLSDRPLRDLRLLDVGCGGGLLCEPLTRLGGQVTGIDPTEEAIKAARLHAAEVGVSIDYRHATAEGLATVSEKFDAVLAMEVVEHVANPRDFLDTCSSLVKPGGALVLATLNRTPKAFLFAIVGAEYVLRWLPRGTHDWRKFLRPSEAAAALRPHGVELMEISGVIYNPVTERWQLSRDVQVNYMAFGIKRE